MRRLDYIAHHGILGQKWGVRRFQNKDGSLTQEGKAHYNKDRETAKKYVVDNIESVESDRYAWEEEWGNANTSSWNKKVSTLEKKAVAAQKNGQTEELNAIRSEAQKLQEQAFEDRGKYVYEKMSDKYGNEIADVEKDAYDETVKYVSELLNRRYDGTLSEEELQDPYWREELQQDVDIYRSARRKLS